MNTDNIQPMRDLMVVECAGRKKQTESGILLPNQAIGNNTLSGKVISTGPGDVSDKTGKLTEIDVKVDDVVLFHFNSGILLTEKGVEPLRFLLREEDILAIVDPA